MALETDNTPEVAALLAMQATQTGPPTIQDLLQQILLEVRKTNLLLSLSFNVDMQSVSNLDLNNTLE